MASQNADGMGWMLGQLREVEVSGKKLLMVRDLGLNYAGTMSMSFDSTRIGE